MSKEKIILTTGNNNCGGKCIIKAHVVDGKIVKITTDSVEDAQGFVPHIACAKGLNYHKTYVTDRRLQYPMKRVGKRGEGKFERISWDEAIDIIANEWKRIRDTYGPGSRMALYATGESGLLSGAGFTRRLLALDGGYLGGYNSYSTACVRTISPYVFGNTNSGNSPIDWLNSKLIVLWGHNPAETIFDSDFMYYLRKAKANHIPLIGIDPRRNSTIKQLDADWYPIRPASDAALADAIAYELVSTDRYDKTFIEKACVGFTKETMPEDIDPKECYFSYLMGEKDGVIKDAFWGEEKTGLAADKIKELADLMWNAKPCNILQGWGPQRNGYGEQATRGVIMLQCLLGNIGKSGGSAGGPGDWGTHKNPSFPSIKNPYPLSIPNFLWTKAVDDYTTMDKFDGIRGAEKLETPVKMLLNIAGNTLINQHSNINYSKSLLEDESKVEFILVSDVFMTASAKFADILLPATSFLEEENITMPWFCSDFLGYNNKVIEPLYESRMEYDWLKEVAKRLDLYEAFTEGHETYGEWLKDLYEDLRKVETELPDIEVLKEKGCYRYKNNPVYIAFEKECEEPEKYPFNTPSGKIEIFSKRLYDMEFKEEFPAIPGYVASINGYEDEKRKDYPLQLVGYHTRRRSHSIHDNNPELEKIDPRAIIMHPNDAKKRGLENGDMTLIYNEYGKVMLPVRITEDIMEGVCAMAQGGWYTPNKDGIDVGGCINTLTSNHATPLAKGNPQHTNLVEVEKVK